jgi:hypothetical protein
MSSRRHDGDDVVEISYRTDSYLGQGKRAGYYRQENGKEWIGWGGNEMKIN